MSEAERLILASGSAARRRMLEQAGVPFTVRPPAIDEAKLKETFLRQTAKAAPQDLAEALAEAKAREVSRHVPGALIVGSDQVLAFAEGLVTKARDRADARRILSALRGQTHQLHSAVAMARDGKIVWRHVGSAHLTMRMFSDAYLDAYLDQAADAVCQSVGAYQLEGIGIQLFDRVEGDYFTILGMPLLPLLHALRAQGMLPS